MLESRSYNDRQIAHVRQAAHAATSVDYTELHQSHEVVLRVEMLAERLTVLNPPRSALVAEIGLGSGDTTKMLLDRFDDVICVDVDRARIEDVWEFLGEVVVDPAKFVCADAVNVSFDEPLDHVFLIGLLEHCADGEAVLLNVKKYLKPSGRIHVLVNNVNSIHRHLGVAVGDIGDIHDLSPSDVRFGHHRVYSSNSIFAEVSRAGFHVDHVDRHYLKPLPSKMMDELPLELSRAFVDLGRKFPLFAAYTYLEAVPF